MNKKTEKQTKMNFAIFCMRNLLKTNVLLCIFVNIALAQSTVFEMNNMPPPQISIEYPAGKTILGTTVTVQVIIPPKWHVNANIAAEEFLKPSTVEIDARGITFGEPVWPKPVKEYSEALNLDNLIFRDTLRIAIPVKAVAAAYDTTTTNAAFTYQACSNFICLAPNTVRASLSEPLQQSPGIEQSRLETPAEQSLLPAKKKSGESVAILLLFAFAGGLILNLMPCVLPVLSLKLFSLIREAGETRKRLLALGLTMTAGVLCSFWVLAGIVTAIRAGGGAAGWGMQFQSLGFIAFMVALLCAFAASLFGAFEAWLPGSSVTRMDAATHREGLPGAFFTGALLVLLSTPCSAPFLGTAMGFAFASPAPVLFAFFTAAGIGLAFPYVLVSVFPQALKVFPKPGPWMVHLQKALGILLLGTVAWLLWVAYGTIGGKAVAFIGGFGLAAIIAGIILGRIAPPGKPFYRELIGGTVLIAALAALWAFAVRPQVNVALRARADAAESKAMDADGWYRYSPGLMKYLAAENHPVFLDVSAEWCLTCKANEAAVIRSTEAEEVFKKYGVTKVKADWTTQNRNVSGLLKTLGRSGVPAYAVYRAGNFSAPAVLPEILTVDAIEQALQK